MTMDDSVFEYMSIFVEYHPSSGRYLCVDNLIGRLLGLIQLHEGPGWVFSSTGAAWFDWSQLNSLTSLVDDLNSTLEE